MKRNNLKHISVTILLSVVTLFAANYAYAQRPTAGEALPVDSSVRVGVLPSGITYYLKHNAKPANRADFHIYYKVGAVQEEDSQNGLAHFLEHMAFNGSQNFPGNTMDEWLATIGVRFGENLNAGTSQEYTTYMITNVPLSRPTITDSILLVLHDWAGHITLDTADVNKERGVILEEWRQGNNAGRRVFEKKAEVLFNKSLYSRRNVIGNQDIIQTFEHQDLVDFYHRWYRPDLQAFVIVGDFNVDEMEQKLIAAMADIKAPSVRTPKSIVTVADNERPLVGVFSDPELTMTSVELLFREKPLRDRFEGAELLYYEYINSLIGRMLGPRFSEISLKENAPFLGAGGSYSSIVRPFDGFYAGGTAREGEALLTLEAVYTELLRMKQSGFTESELERAKTDIMRGTQSYFENRNDRKNGEFVQGYMDHFVSGAAYLTPEQDIVLTRRILDAITLKDVNTVAASWIRDQNSAVMISMPEKDSIAQPTESEVLAVIEIVKRANVAAYVDQMQDKPLMDASGLVGSVVTKSSEGKYGSTVMMLENGVRVIVKPTTLKADEVTMSAFQNGGTSTVSDVVDLYNLSMLPPYLGMSGVGEFSRTDLTKVLTGKIANVSPSIGNLSQDFNGSCSPKDIETMMQLTYLYYTAPRFEQSEWNVLMNQYRSILPNVEKNPNYILQDSVSETVYGRNPRRFMQPSGEVLDTVSLERMEALYRQFFANADGMTFTFVGNISVDSLRPLAEKYLGSLPSMKGKAPKWGEHNVVPVSGVVENRYKTPLETPKVTAIQFYSGELPYTLARNVNMDAIRYILEMRYIKSIREEKGGTYGVRVSMNYSKVPTSLFTFQIYFDTDESKLEELLPLVQKEIDDLSANGATPEELTKTKEFFTKKYRDGLIHNGTWMSYLNSWYRFANNRYDGYEALIAALSTKSIRSTASDTFGQGNICTVIQSPLEEAEKQEVMIDSKIERTIIKADK